MKTKRFLLMLTIAFGLLVATASLAMAATYDCIVTAVGPAYTTPVYVRLTDTAATPAFTDRWFKFNDDRKKEMLAVALTAMANNKKVRMVVSLPNPYYTITEFYLLPN